MKPEVLSAVSASVANWWRDSLSPSLDLCPIHGDCRCITDQQSYQATCLLHLKLLFLWEGQSSCGNEPDQELEVRAAGSKPWILIRKAIGDVNVPAFFTCVCVNFLMKLCSKCQLPNLSCHTETKEFSAFYEKKKSVRASLWKPAFHQAVNLPQDCSCGATNHAFGMTLNVEIDTGNPTVICQQSFMPLLSCLEMYRLWCIHAGGIGVYP